MELDAQARLARLLAHDADYYSCAASVEQRDGYLLYHSASLVGRLDANHAGAFRAVAGAGQAIAREIVEFYHQLGTAPAAYVDALSTPPDLIPCLVDAGFRERRDDGATDLMLLAEPDVERPSEFDSAVAIGAALEPGDRDAWAGIGPEDATPDARRRQIALGLAEIADPRAIAYLARVDGRPASRCQLFSSRGLGRIESVRTLRPSRRRGLAAAVVRRAVTQSLALGNELTYLLAEQGSDAQRLYVRLGFRTVKAEAVRVFVHVHGQSGDTARL